MFVVCTNLWIGFTSERWGHVRFGGIWFLVDGCDFVCV